jgi:hypothetical protein
MQHSIGSGSLKKKYRPLRNSLAWGSGSNGRGFSRVGNGDGGSRRHQLNPNPKNPSGPLTRKKIIYNTEVHGPEVPVSVRAYGMH